LYERAAQTIRGAPRETRPIWHLEPGRALFAGSLGHNAAHAHSVPVLLAGLYEPFRLRVAGGDWLSCAAAVIPAGVSYEFDVAGYPLAVLYLEPSEAGAETLVPFVSQGREERGAVVGASDIAGVLRDLYEAPDGASVNEALDDLLGYATPRVRRTFDPRVARVVASLSIDAEHPLSVAEVARQVGLSPSRFQHLFAAEVGVPFRRFRVWQRLRTAIADIVAGSSFTDAAHRAGFFDQAHFGRAFRQAFGAPASPSLRRVRRS
jgi:AraC-like DNA-binding protein